MSPGEQARVAEDLDRAVNSMTDAVSIMRDRGATEVMRTSRGQPTPKPRPRATTVDTNVLTNVPEPPAAKPVDTVHPWRNP